MELPITTHNIPQGKEIATLGGGCFWCIEPIFSDLIGVEKVESGYAGGHVVNPTYEAICQKTTGHAEVIQITFDPKIISFADILTVFWTVHDPTTLNRQGGDAGPQYRSVVFYHSENQKTTVENSIASVASEIYKDPIVTEVTAFQNYYKAESYHQDYYNKVGSQNSYCTFVISPKVAKFRKLFSKNLKSNQV